MKRFFTLALVAGILLGIKLFYQKPNPQPKIIIDKHIIFVEIAGTPQKRSQGLSDRNSLAKNHGMLFIFENLGNYSFWMNKMKFNLDFIFINGDKIVDLEENIPFPKLDEKPKTINSREPFDKVLEINQETIKSLNIKIEDPIKIVF